jgi:hypothetical protein
LQREHPSYNKGSIVKKIVIFCMGLSLIAMGLFPVTPAQAAVRTYVSGTTGSDSNNCTFASPCQSIAHAVMETAANGIVSCLDANDYSGSVTLTISIEIDCSNAVGGATFGPFTISGSNITVVIRGGTIFFATKDAITITNAATVHIEDVNILGCPAGIVDNRTGGGTQLFVRNSIIRHNTGAGIVAAAAATNGVVIENVQSVQNKYGVAAATGNNVVVSRSVMSGNSVAGVEADPGAQVSVNNTEITHNIVVGVQAYGKVTLANSDISYNSAAISGATVSYGNNRIFGNPESSTAPTPIGGASSDYGQQ